MKILLILLILAKKNIRVKFGIPNSPQSPDIGQNSDGGISDFRISSQSLINDDTEMKLGPVTKLGKRNTATSKKNGNDVMFTNCDVFIIFPIYVPFGA